MQIKEANINDVRKISYLIKKNTDKVKENNYTNEQITVWKNYNSPAAIKKSLFERKIFCAFQNDKLVGTIGLEENEVVGLYVSFNKRGQGIGRALLRHLEEYANNRNIQELTLCATPSALNFYKNNGYEVEKEVVVKISGVAFYETRMTKKI